MAQKIRLAIIKPTFPTPSFNFRYLFENWEIWCLSEASDGRTVSNFPARRPLDFLHKARPPCFSSQRRLPMEKAAWKVCALQGLVLAFETK